MHQLPVRSALRPRPCPLRPARCSIYAFGMVLYELLTGRPPWQGLAQLQVRQLHSRAPTCTHKHACGRLQLPLPSLPAAAHQR